MAQSRNRFFSRACNLSVAALIVAGCASTPKDSGSRDKSLTDNVGSVVEQPFKDLNLSHDEIPGELKQIMTKPYVSPTALSCDGVAAEIDVLNTVLGSDIDEVVLDAKGRPKTSIDVWAMAQNAAGGFIPLRGVVRQVTGAEARSQEIKQAILAGFVRRGYLKGLRSQLGCHPIAASTSIASDSSTTGGTNEGR